MPALAKSSYLNEIKKKYPDPKIAKTLTCAICHADMTADRTKMTLFGQDFKKLTGAATEKIAKLEKLDSDKDGFTNLEELKAGANPSDPKSTPKTVASQAKADAKTSGTLTASKTTAKANAKTTATQAKSKLVNTAPAGAEKK